MGRIELTREEKVVLHVINTLGCITRSQAITIYTEYYGYTEAKADVCIMRMARLKKIHLTEDKQFILRGTPNSHYAGTVDRNKIEMLYGVLEYVRDKNDFESLYGEKELSFISDRQSYTVVHCNSSSMQPIEYQKDKYTAKRNRLMANAQNPDEEMVETIGGTIIFVYSYGVDEDTIMEKINAIGIDFPCAFLFFKDNNLSSRPEYTIYD